MSENSFTGEATFTDGDGDVLAVSAGSENAGLFQVRENDGYSVSLVRLDQAQLRRLRTLITFLIGE